MKKVEILDKRFIFDDKYKIEEVKLRYEQYNGEMSKDLRRLSFERGDSVAALLHNTSDDTFTLIEQFRYSTWAKGPGWLQEVVAGTLEKGEDPKAGMIREIEEEAGIAVPDIEHIGTFYTSPGGSTERVFLYYAPYTAAMIKNAGGGLEEEGEDIRVIHLKREEMRTLVLQNKVEDCKTMIALQWVLLHKS